MTLIRVRAHHHHILLLLTMHYTDSFTLVMQVDSQTPCKVENMIILEMPIQSMITRG